MRPTQLLAAVFLLAWAIVPAAAQDNTPMPFGLSEIRGGAYVTGIELWRFSPWPGEEQFERLDTLEVELLFEPPDNAIFGFLNSPRISVGTIVSTLGRASLIHAGLTWDAQLFESPFFLEGTFGGALTNSTLSGAVAPDRNVGCPALLYFSVGAGAKFDAHWSVMGSIYHASHAALCGLDKPNEGLNGMGIKVGYSF